jgi:transposase
MTYSIDFRQKVLSIKEQEGLTVAEVALSFGIGVASITRWCKRLEPQRTQTRPATKIDMEALVGDVENTPDAYQYERAARWGVSQRAIGDALKRLNVSDKKTQSHPKADEDARRIFQGKIEAYQANNQSIIYIDESGFAHDRPRTHGYAPIGKRCVGKYNWHAKGRTNVIAALLASFADGDSIHWLCQRRCVFCLAFARFVTQTTATQHHCHG